METIDEEITKASLDYLEKAKKADKPFFLWWNSTRMHIWTRLKKESEGKTGLGLYPDGMVEHDAMVGQLLDKLKELGLDDNTIVMYSTDNGAEKMSWPDGGQSPFRSEKGTNWEGGFRVPCAIRWPGVIKPGTVFNDIFAHEDMLPTLLAAAGDPDVKDKLLKGMKVGDKTFKVHLDGYNITDALAGKSPSPRHDFDPCVVAAACASFSRDSRGFYLPKGCSFVYSNSEMERSVAVSRGRIECGRAA
jgi:arylsulfatase